ncbi:MAG: hypothetical protein H7Z40_01910 [Phycisphaerae bacterium]|nr:hypothetical protein [Gemmatimonadaceae bacterium]
MCCGKNRAAAQAGAIAAAKARASSSRVMGGPVDTGTSEIMFEFVGDGSASIRGPASGRVYRFAAAGDRLRVDARDRPGLLALPALRWVR